LMLNIIGVFKTSYYSRHRTSIAAQLTADEAALPTSILKNMRSLESSSPILSGIGFSPPAFRNSACRAAGTLNRR